MEAREGETPHVGLQLRRQRGPKGDAHSYRRSSIAANLIAPVG